MVRVTSVQPAALNTTASSAASQSAESDSWAVADLWAHDLRRAPSSGLQPGALTPSQPSGEARLDWPLVESLPRWHGQPQTAWPVMAITKCRIWLPPVNLFTVTVRALSQGGHTGDGMVRAAAWNGEDNEQVHCAPSRS